MNKGCYKKGHIPWIKGRKKKKICLNCGKEFSSTTSNGSIGRRKYCSQKCSGLGQGFKKGQNAGEKNTMWVGDSVSYQGLHCWLIRNYGSPKECSLCGEVNPIKRYEWANISGEYKRDINDYIRLCKKCHNDKDGVNAWQNQAKWRQDKVYTR